MKIAVTGANGYIGRYVLPLLVARGHEVLAISNRVDQTDEAGLRWLEADLLDTEACRRVMIENRSEGLLHLAWYAEHGKFWTAPENFAWMQTTSCLLEAFRDAGGRRAVLAGTCAEYDWSYGYCVEDKTPLAPRSIYGKCKDETRQFAEAFCQANGIGFAWARIFFPYGPGEPEARLLPSVLRSLCLGQPVKCSHGRQFRDFIHVSDAAAALTHLLVTSQKNGAFNIASGEPMRLGALVQLCANHFPEALPIEFGAVPVAADDPPMLVGSAEKLLESGWCPQISVDEGIARYVKHYVDLLRG
ncbi:MAG: dTDP-6-deoxy-L-talose 4-dehydrogenase (NAD(+)) [Betaproteobacteria bacterium ADurb.Bin341]|nr:MAG: dTDP-6-deoxy-L-talose 4-dehydrogenase (NAD(+)) [Betaproteobacteria bacterium ADurb.Bin341]